MTNQENAQKAFDIDKSIKANELQRRKLFIANILGLIQMYDEKLYQYLQGEGVKPNWAGYLSDTEKYYTRSKVEMWRKILNRLVKKFGIDINLIIEVPATRLEKVARFSKNKEEAELLIADAKVLTSRDFKDLIRKKQGKVSLDDCQHEFVEYKICSVCGLKNKA